MEDFNAMNEPINEFADTSNLDYIEGAMDYTHKMYEDLIDNYNQIYEKRLRDAMKNTGLKASKRREILDLVLDLIGLSDCYADYIYNEGEERQTEILLDMEEEEHSQIANSEYCEMSGGNCDDCYISECASSVCNR